MLNCLFFRIFSSVSFVSLYQTKAQRSGFCLELRSKGAERGMPSPAGRYTRSGLCDEVVGTGFCPQTAFGREPVGRRLAKCDAGSSRTGGFFPLRRGFSALGWNIVPAFLALPARRRNVGLCGTPAPHTRSLGKKPHTAATRASRCAPGVRHTRRADRADCFHGRKIGTIGTFERNPPFAVATVGIRQNPVFS